MTEFSLAGARICVTGGTGFLGQHLLPLLMDAGAEVTCLARPHSSAKKLPAGVTRVYGDCEDGESLGRVFANQDIIIHMAGLLFGTGWRDYMRANVRASQNIAAILGGEHKNARLVFVSSLAAAGPCAAPEGVDESRMPEPVSAYGWSKYMCERVFECALGKRLVVLRPPVIYGSGDRGLLPLFRSAKAGVAVSPGYGRKFPLSIIHARDAARAIALACSRNSSGTYHLNDGAAHDMDSFCAAMSRALGKDKIYVAHMPLPLMAATASLSSMWGFMAERIGRMAGKNPRPPQWNLDKYREAREAGWVANASRIREELGFEPIIDIESGMAEAVAGYRARGWL